MILFQWRAAADAESRAARCRPAVRALASPCDGNANHGVLRRRLLELRELLLLLLRWLLLLLLRHAWVAIALLLLLLHRRRGVGGLRRVGRDARLRHVHARLGRVGELHRALLAATDANHANHRPEDQEALAGVRGRRAG